MELVKDEALFVVRHHVTEENLQRLEKGTRLLGMSGRGKKILTGFLVIAVISLALKGFFDGMAALILAALGGAMLLIAFAGFYVMVKGWMDSKQIGRAHV